MISDLDVTSIGPGDEESTIRQECLRRARTRGVKTQILLYGKAVSDSGEVYHHSIEKRNEIDEEERSLDPAVDGKVSITGSLGTLVGFAPGIFGFSSYNPGVPFY